MAVVSVNSLPVGFRFRPTDEELINCYLRAKINGNKEVVKVICEIDVCKREPWDLPELSIIKVKDTQWFFFCPLDLKYQNGHRLNRATKAGYWKATGKDRKIKSGAKLIGMKKTLVFYIGRAPNGKRTFWVMHEYRATVPELDGTRPGQSRFVLCRLFKKPDDTIKEDVECDEVAGVSPTTAQFSPEVMQSEVAAAEASPTNRVTSDVVECQSNGSNGFETGDQSIDVTTADNEILDEDWKQFYDPSREQIDYKLFSPLHGQLQSEMPCSYGYPGTTTDLNNYGMQAQYDVIDLLNSPLNLQEDCSFDGSDLFSYVNGESVTFTTFNKDTGSVSGSDVEMAQLLLDQDIQGSVLPKDDISLLQVETTSENFKPVVMGQGSSSISTAGRLGRSIETNNKTIPLDNDAGVPTGIRIRSRISRSQPNAKNSAGQGEAPRRLRLQCRLQVQPTLIGANLMELNNVPEAYESKPIISEVKDASSENEYKLAEVDESDKLSKENITNAGVKTTVMNKFSTIKKVPFIFAKASFAHRSIGIFRITGLVVVFAVLVSTCRWMFCN